MNEAVTPFRIEVPDSVLADLAERLDRVRWPDEIPGGGWDYGTDLATLVRTVDHWRTKYDWRTWEAELNRWPHRSVPLGGIDVRFLHVPGNGPDPMPLLLLHGWPGSIWEFHRILPLLTDPGAHGGDPADAFTVVAPSLPGYGFSFRPGQPRFSIPEIAPLMAELMVDVLGYDRYGAQGGDWGSAIATRLGSHHPEHLAGVHLNLLFARPPLVRVQDRTPEETAAAAQFEHWKTEGTGYQWIQGTRPQTLSYALTDSPVGLCAWLLEKFRAWSDCDGDVERRFPPDVFLTNVMIYWVTGAIGSSFWPYYAVRHDAPLWEPGKRVAVPTGFAEFPREILRTPRAWAEQLYNIVHWTTMPAGGHFAAMEEPEALAADIRAFFRTLR